MNLTSEQIKDYIRKNPGTNDIAAHSFLSCKDKSVTIEDIARLRQEIEAHEIEEMSDGSTSLSETWRANLVSDKELPESSIVPDIGFMGVKPMTIKSPGWHMPGLIPQKRLTSISGPSGVGKTVFTANIFDALSGGQRVGKTILGFEAKQPVRVYYECYERGADYLMETFDRVFRKTWPTYPESLARYVSPSTIKGSRVDWVKGILGRLSFKPDVIILDHVSKLVPYNTTACSNFLERLEEFGLKAGIAFIVLFQPVKDGKGTAKGRSEDAANFSSKIEIWPIGGKKVKIRVKSHLGERKGIIAEQDDFQWRLVGEFDPDQVTETSSPSSDLDRVRAILKPSVRRIKTALNCGTDRAAELLRQL